MKYWHIGLLTPDIDETINFLCAASGAPRDKWAIFEIEFPQSVMVTGDGGKLRAAFGRVGGIAIELLQPLDDSSYHAKTLKARGPGFHHVAYVCEDNMDEKVKELLSAGGRIVWEARLGNEHPCYIESAGETAVLEIINCCPFDPGE